MTRLSVPSVWEDKLIQKLVTLNSQDVKIDSVYGSKDISVVGSGRPSCILPRATKKRIKDYIALVHSYGIKFIYLLNSSCMGNVEYTSTGRKQLYEYLNWVYDIGADAVKVAIPLIIELVKKEFPDLEVHVSVNAHVDSVQKVKAFEELGADSINLDPMINRDFALLKRIRQVTRCEIELLVNQSCLYNCAYREYHNNIISHWSQDLGNKNVNICQHITCLVKKLTHPEELLKATWIRPEDLSIYECMGIDSFKIAGREKSASWILNCVAAYCRRSYRGNLTDLLVPDFSVFSVYEKYGKIDKPEIFVDNRLLTGFLETVSKRNCRVECGTDCKYCYTLARKVVVIKNKEKFVKFVQQIKDDLMHV